MRIKVGVDHIPVCYNDINKGAVEPLARSMVDYQHGATRFDIAKGDNETRPANIALNFIIKMTNDAKIPTGCVIPYARADDSQVYPRSPWHICSGSGKDRSDYEELFKVIGTRFTGSGTAFEFSVPKLQGQFIRGVDHGVGMDPDERSRLPAPNNDYGRGFVGTTQDYATSTQKRTVNIDHYPKKSYSLSYITKGHTNQEAGKSSSKQTWAGWAEETRPDNVAVSYWINARDSAPNLFPLGGIIAVPGGLEPDPNYWTPADGRSLLIADYPKLFDALQITWGGTLDHTKFNLPDLRDQFLRAADTNINPHPGEDPDRFRRYSEKTGGAKKGTGSQQDFATGCPKLWQQLQGTTVVRTQDSELLQIDLMPQLASKPNESEKIDRGINISVPGNWNDNVAGIDSNKPMGEHTNRRSFFAIDWKMSTEKDEYGKDKNLANPDTETAPKHVSVSFFVKTPTHSPTSAQPVKHPSKL